MTQMTGFICWLRFLNPWQGPSSHQGNSTDSGLFISGQFTVSSPPPLPTSPEFKGTGQGDEQASFLKTVDGLPFYSAQGWRNFFTLLPSTDGNSSPIRNCKPQPGIKVIHLYFSWLKAVKLSKCTHLLEAQDFCFPNFVNVNKKKLNKFFKFKTIHIFKTNVITCYLNN